MGVHLLQRTGEKDTLGVFLWKAFCFCSHVEEPHQSVSSWVSTASYFCITLPEIQWTNQQSTDQSLQGKLLTVLTIVKYLIICFAISVWRNLDRRKWNLEANTWIWIHDWYSLAIGPWVDHLTSWSLSFFTSFYPMGCREGSMKYVSEAVTHSA